VFDSDNESLVADGSAKDAVVQGNVFLRPGGSTCIAPELNAGGNFWGSVTEEATGEKISGNVVLAPWQAAAGGGLLGPARLCCGMALGRLLRLSCRRSPPSIRTSPLDTERAGQQSLRSHPPFATPTPIMTRPPA
jgi:hypothetical protein